MPTINKLPKKPKSTAHNDTEMRVLRQTFYNTTKWRKARLAHLQKEPLCQECLKKGKITPADSVHHKVSPFKDMKINWTLGLDDNNLESICQECHAELHAKEQGHQSPADLIKILDELLLEDNWDEDK